MSLYSLCVDVGWMRLSMYRFSLWNLLLSSGSTAVFSTNQLSDYDFFSLKLSVLLKKKKKKLFLTIISQLLPWQSMTSEWRRNLGKNTKQIKTSVSAVQVFSTSCFASLSQGGTSSESSKNKELKKHSCRGVQCLMRRDGSVIGSAWPHLERVWLALCLDLSSV